METFSRYWPFVLQMPMARSFDVSLICAWINAWVNNGEAGDLKRHLADYDVTVMVNDVTI